ncbi:MAG: DUF1559 domain-containing protein [Thermoguttaceae bacterium]
MKYPVRFSFALVLSACVSGMLPASLLAEEKPSMQSKPFQEKLAALLDDETLCVVHVDFTQIDTDAVLDNTRVFVEKLFDKVGLTETDRDSLRASLEPSCAPMPLNWNHSKALAKTGKAFLVDTLGVREAFLVVQTGGRSFPALVWGAIPKHEKLNVSMLTAALKDKSFHVRETDDFCFITMLNASLARRVNLANVGPNDAAARPEFLEAHQVVKDYPVQVLIALPKYVKKVLRETKPTLPGEFEKINLASMLDALRWKAIGVNPEKMEFLAVAEAESENDAQSLYRIGSDLFTRASETLISALRKYKETPGDKNRPVRDGSSKPTSIADRMPDVLQVVRDAYPEFINEETLKQLGEFLIPKPEGKRIVVKGNADTLQRVVDKGTPFMRATIEKVIEGERNRQRSMLPQNRLRQIALAMANYYSTYGTFPPPYTVDKNGKPLHSWRVLILAFLDEDNLYRRIRLNEPWDSEYNKQFHNQMPGVYHNSTYPGSDKKGETNFCMVVGPDTFAQANGKGRKISEIKNGASHTIMLVERQTPVCWMAPIDIEQEKAYLGINQDPAGIGGKTPGGVFAAYVNAAVKFVKQTTPLEQLKASLTINGGKAP